MNIDMNSMMQLMIASSLLSGKEFTMDNFMGGLTFDKLLGLQMLSNTNFNGTVNLQGDPSHSTQAPATSNFTKEDLLEIVKAMSPNTSTSPNA